MIATRPSEAPEPSEETAQRTLYVPVDASPASEGAVALALRLAQHSAAEIGLLALLNAEGEASNVAALQDQVRKAGVPVSLDVLDGQEAAARLRRLIDATPSSALVLGDPGSLGVALRDLTLELLTQPPCTVYLADSPASSRREPGLMLLAFCRSLWQRLRC